MDIDEELFSNVLSQASFNDNMTILQFGVATGNTLAAILNVLIQMDKKPKRVIGFDSFKGLPSEEEGIPIESLWCRGAFSLLQENLNNSKIHQKAATEEEAYSMMRDRFTSYETHDIFVDLVEGFYSDSLKPNIVADYNIKPAFFIDIDCDLYISAKQALEFIITNNLMAENCLLRYDDWQMNSCSEGEGGESKAHNEMVEKYGLVFDTVRKDRDSVFRYRNLTL